MSLNAEEIAKIRRIIDRAYQGAVTGPSKLDLTISLEASHQRRPLDLDRLLEGRITDVVHDVYGVHRHLDRATGELTDFFSPRFTKRKG